MNYIVQMPLQCHPHLLCVSTIAPDAVGRRFECCSQNYTSMGLVVLFRGWNTVSEHAKYKRLKRGLIIGVWVVDVSIT